MSKFNGLFLGLTTIDIQYFVEEFPKSNLKIKTQAPDILVGGPAANAAVTFARLNGSSTLATAVGNNSFTDFIVTDFQKAGVQPIDLVDGSGFNPILATVVTSSKNGDRNIFTHNPGQINAKITGEQLIDSNKPDILMLDGFYYETGLECAEIAKTRNIPIVLDCGSWKPQYEELIEYADFVICSEDFYPQNTVNSQQVLDYLRAKQTPFIAVSRGEKPILLYENTKQDEIKINNLQIVDSLGAGDVFHGAFCYYILQHKNFKTALENAARVATFSCRYKGTREWLNHF